MADAPAPSWLYHDSFAVDVACRVPPQREGQAKALVAGRVYWFGGAVMNPSAPVPSPLPAPAPGRGGSRPGSAPRPGGGSSGGGLALTNATWAYDCNSGVWLPVPYRNGAPADASPDFIPADTIMEAVWKEGDRVAAAAPTDGGAPTVDPLPAPPRPSSRGGRTSTRRGSLSSFLSALPIHVPSARCHSAAAGDVGKVTILIPASPDIQSHLRKRLADQMQLAGLLDQHSGSGAGSGLVSSFAGGKDRGRSSSGQNHLAITAVLVDSPSWGMMWLHGGEGGYITPSTGPVGMSAAAGAAGMATSSLTPAATPQPAPYQTATGDWDIPVTISTASIGNTHGFQLHGKESLAGVLQSSRTGADDAAVGTSSPAPSLASRGRRASAGSLDSAGFGGATARSRSRAGSVASTARERDVEVVPRLGKSASVAMLQSMLRGGGNNTVLRDLFDDLFAFDVKTHTWRKIDTAANALKDKAPDNGDGGPSRLSRPSFMRSRASGPSPAGTEGDGAVGANTGAGTGKGDGDDVDMASAFAKPRARRNHSLLSVATLQQPPPGSGGLVIPHAASAVAPAGGAGAGADDSGLMTAMSPTKTSTSGAAAATGTLPPGSSNSIELVPRLVLFGGRGEFAPSTAAAVVEVTCALVVPPPFPHTCSMNAVSADGMHTWEGVRSGCASPPPPPSSCPLPSPRRPDSLPRRRCAG